MADFAHSEGCKCRLQLRRKLVVMGGDLGLPGLGLSAEDRQTLMREVHYIVHSAASISFVDHIHNLISHNYIVSSAPALPLLSSLLCLPICETACLPERQCRERRLLC